MDTQAPRKPTAAVPSVTLLPLKTFLILLLALCLVASAQAQAPVAPGAAPLLTPDALDQLLGPIALYPDSLIALILPASTGPSDIVLAARYVSANADPAQIPNQPWDDSVKALTRYPDLLQWLSQNLDWTTQLGDAFVAQPADVMDAIQQLRARARAAGTLVDTPQQQVVLDNGDISIEPTDANSLYMPEYDPDDVYDEGYGDEGPLITFGPAYPVGPWLDYGIDWRHRGVYRGDWRGGDYRGRGGAGNAGIANASPWYPDPNRAREVRSQGRGYAAVSRPKALPGVTIPHGTRAAGNLSRPAGRDFTGWSRPAVPEAQGRLAAPAEVSHEPAPQGGGLFNEYRRGSDARESSARGQLSRQPPATPAIYRPPAESFSRPAPVRPELERAAPTFERPASAFHVNTGAAAHASSARGAQSRGRR